MDAARKVLEQVQGRLIGPVNVFDDQNCGSLVEFVEEGGEERRAVRIPFEKRPKRGKRLLRDVIEWTQRARCEQCLACCPECARWGMALLARLRQKALDQ